MTTLHLPLKAEYFDAIRDGTKTEEYRLANAYWKKRLIIGGPRGVLHRSFDGIVLTKGYPKRDDQSRRMELPWRGFSLKTITHPHFGPDDPVNVFAIAVSSIKEPAHDQQRACCYSVPGYANTFAEGDFSTAEDAKAACEAEYQKRIRAVLFTQPAQGSSQP